MESLSLEIFKTQLDMVLSDPVGAALSRGVGLVDLTGPSQPQLFHDTGFV